MALAIPLVTDTSLRAGDYGLAVFSLQRAANKLGIKVDGKTISEDLSFGPLTKRAAIAVQSLIGTTPDGMVGPVTQALLTRYICDKQELKITTYMPKGLLVSNCNYESSGYLGSVDWSVAGGVDVGVTACRIYTAEYSDDALVLDAFDSHRQVERMAGNFITLYIRFLNREAVKGNKEFATRLAVLNHNFPSAADTISRKGIANLTPYWYTSAAWITNLPYVIKFPSGRRVTTPLQWCQRYSLGNAAEQEPGQAVKLVSSYA